MSHICIVCQELDCERDNNVIELIKYFAHENIEVRFSKSINYSGIIVSFLKPINEDQKLMVNTPYEFVTDNDNEYIVKFILKAFERASE